MVDTSLNLIVIRSSDIDRAAQFYSLLGLQLEKHRHDNGPLHYSAKSGAIVFEIYPRKNDTESTASVRLGFRVASVESVITTLKEAGGRVISAPQSSEWGKRAVIDDPDGHRIELTEATSQQ